MSQILKNPYQILKNPYPILKDPYQIVSNPYQILRNLQEFYSSATCWHGTGFGWDRDGPIPALRWIDLVALFC